MVTERLKRESSNPVSVVTLGPTVRTGAAPSVNTISMCPIMDLGRRKSAGVCLTGSVDRLDLGAPTDNAFCFTQPWNFATRASFLSSSFVHEICDPACYPLVG